MMRLYDEICQEFIKLTKDKEGVVPDSYWPLGDQNEILFKSDTAYELGGGILPAQPGFLVTGSDTLVPKDEVILIGPDLSEIKKDTPYARIVMVRVNDEKMGSGNHLYQSIRKMDYTRYHITPKGFMMRISAMNQRESVRISKGSIKAHISFLPVGNDFIRAYHENEAIEAVKVVFITDRDFPYLELTKLMEKAENITKALDHLLNKVKMDCHTCGLQKICNEVEELCKEDFKTE